MKVLCEDKDFQYGFIQPIRFYWLKRLVYPFANLFYHILTSAILKKHQNKKYNLSLILIFKDEAPFLKEWLEYHIMLGVSHFYLYQNNSSDNYMQVISPYMEQGLITLIGWPEYPGQYSAYLDWYKNYRHETNWASFIDADEFLCPVKDDSLADALKQYKKYPVVLVYWKLFGTSGHMIHNYRKLVIEQYYCCRPKLFSEGKIIYNTRFDAASDFISMHGMVTKWHGIKIMPVNIFHKFVIWDLHYANRRRGITIQLNHYWSKAFECWKQKYKKGSIEKGICYKDYNFFERLEYACTSTDHTIFRFLVKLKIRLKYDNQIKSMDK